MVRKMKLSSFEDSTIFMPQSEVNITLATSEATSLPIQKSSRRLCTGKTSDHASVSESKSVSTESEEIVSTSEATFPYEDFDYNIRDFNAQKFRNAVITLNNYTQAELDQCILTAKNVATYGVIGQEIAPTTGTPHLQMYFEFANQKRVSEIKSMTSSRIAIFKRRGTPIQASDYCKYDDYKEHCKDRLYQRSNVYHEFGELSHQGERTDWTTVKDRLMAGESIVSVIDHHPHVLPNIRAIKEFRSEVAKSQHRDVKVYVLFGVSGSGKTKWAWDTYPDLYTKPDGEWWDGYAGQKTVLLDDFYGGIPHHTMLKICDRYPLSLPIKGGFAPACYDTVIITSNKHPSHWYENGLKALTRRLHSVALVNNIAQPVLFHNFEEFRQKVPVHPPEDLQNVDVQSLLTKK